MDSTGSAVARSRTGLPHATDEDIADHRVAHGEGAVVVDLAVLPRVGLGDRPEVLHGDS